MIELVAVTPNVPHLACDFVQQQMHLMLLAGLACTGCSIVTTGIFVVNWYNMVAASAAGGFSFVTNNSLWLLVPISDVNANLVASKHVYM
jgi:hypothetical protein